MEFGVGRNALQRPMERDKAVTLRGVLISNDSDCLQQKRKHRCDSS